MEQAYFRQPQPRPVATKLLLYEICFHCRSFGQVGTQHMPYLFAATQVAAKAAGEKALLDQITNFPSPEAILCCG